MAIWRAIAAGAFLLTSCAFFASAQEAGLPGAAFAPFVMPEPVTASRSASGAPTSAYWQNSADYEIHAQLDPAAKTLTARETITYTNNSPDPLDVLWLQLDQNLYQADARARFASDRSPSAITEGYRLSSVEIEDGIGVVNAEYLISDTRMQIRLPHLLAARGGKVRLRISYRYAIPQQGGRTGWQSTPGGEIFDIAQWYPRMAVYDDLRGWDTLPYIASEFYLEYGQFDYDITAPSDMIVAGTGALVNPREVLTPRERARLEQARSSDKTVMIRAPAEISDPASRPGHGLLTWRFHVDKARDVAFAASKAFAWDAARVNLPEGKTSLAMSYYPAESAGADAWSRSTEYLKHAIEEFSRRWTIYPYPTASNVAGPVSGMEYPSVLFNGAGAKTKTLFYLTAHEIGHNWFPMVVGTNERRHAWMDEGFNTFIDVYESDAFNNGEYKPKRDNEYAPGGGNPADEIVSLLTDPAAPPIMSPADTIPAKYGHPVSYFKTAFGLVMLREQILGPARFDPAFRKFIRDWSWKHPSPSDFFRTMNSEGGEDLSWFWRGWFEHNWAFDLAVKDIQVVKDDPKGVRITIANLDRLILPADLQIQFADGSTDLVHLPAETWLQKTVVSVFVPTTKPVAAVTIDPDHKTPDKDRANNFLRPTRMGVQSEGGR